MRIGSSIGVNHRAGSVYSLPKKVLENTLTTSPKKLPYINPQKTVPIPQKKNIRRDLRIELSIFRNFRRQKAQAAAIIMP